MLQACFTKYDKLNAEPVFVFVSRERLVEHLKSREDAAAVVETQDGEQFYILKQQDLFHYGSWPAEDPNDAEASESPEDALDSVLT